MVGWPVEIIIVVVVVVVVRCGVYFGDKLDKLLVYGLRCAGGRGFSFERGE